MSDRPVLLFDGVCNLCNGVVQFTLRREREPRLLFVPLQSEAGQRIAAAHGVDARELSTVVMIEDGRAFLRSAAAVRLCRHLRAPWPVLGGLLWLVPWPLRDVGYRIVAAVRYRLWGRRDTCMVPTPEVKARFLA